MSKNSKLSLSLSAAALAIALTTGGFYLAESISGENQLLNSIKVLGFCPVPPSGSPSPEPSATNGTDGEAGANGADGANGTDGVDGEAGTDGSAGTHGSDGSDGSDGEAGTDGAPGEAGTDGVDGTNGVDGTDGVNGADGAAGICTDPITLSAIEGDLVPAVDNGYSLGTPQFRWKSLQLGPGTLYIEDMTTHIQAGLTVDDGTLLIDGVDSLRIGNIRLTATGIRSILSDQDITIGAPGDTGYLAVANGIRFPDDSFLTSASGIIGPTGPQGLIGPQGPSGATGPQGMQGLQGATGAQGPVGATGAQGPAGTSGFGNFGSWYDTTTQTNLVANDINVMTFNQPGQLHGVSISQGSKITFSTAGTYNVQFSAQADKTDSGLDDFEIWLSKNGSAEAFSNTGITINGNNAKVAAAWNFFVTVEAGDFVELNWASADVDLRLLSQPATSSPARPGIPSVILTVNQVQ